MNVRFFQQFDYIGRTFQLFERFDGRLAPGRILNVDILLSISSISPPIGSYFEMSIDGEKIAFGQAVLPGGRGDVLRLQFPIFLTGKMIEIRAFTGNDRRLSSILNFAMQRRSVGRLFVSLRADRRRVLPDTLSSRVVFRCF